MTELKLAGYELKNLGKINIVLGKNGCGKSTLLKGLDNSLMTNVKRGVIKYITPERGGKLSYNPNIDSSIFNDNNWLCNTRRKNQLGNFREQSVSQLKSLELLFFREMENTEKLRGNFAYTFDSYFDRINELLDNIVIKRDKSIFKIYKKGDLSKEINPECISSGEAELISLGIECLVFEKECISDKNNYLLLDEPDVHLHPDLQARLCHFLLQIGRNNKTCIILATHSTAILGALESFEETHICFMKAQEANLEFRKITKGYKKILPIFGAHPLSSLYNQLPVFLVEGEDEERIWQQAVRTSNNKLKIYPCSVDGEGNMSLYEKDVNNIINSVYDVAKAYSLRDRDDGKATIEDEGNVVRFKLACRTSENLLLTDEVLETLKINWDQLKLKITEWLNVSEKHFHYKYVKEFIDGGFDRKLFNIKDIRNDLMHIIGSSISWEVAIGKTIGGLISAGTINNQEHSIFTYLGDKIIGHLFSKN